MRYLFLIISFVSSISFSQIAQYNSYPTLHSYKILDEKLDSISFAFSMRQLNTSYVGPFLKLRRASDNAELDFYKGFNDIVDIDSINSWRSGANVYVTTWYDQSGLGRNAVQPTTSFQPQFIPDSARPYFVGDGISDRLDVLTSIQILTNSGVNGTVSLVLYNTSRSQNSFGVLNVANRWSVHINWTNGRAYFDPGVCCNTPRDFINPVNVWKQYTFIRTSSSVVVRRNTVQVMNGSYTTGACTISNNFGILYANGANFNYSTGRFTELIMYKYDIAAYKYKAIELNQIYFWNL